MEAAPDECPMWKRSRRQQARTDLAAWAARPWGFTAVTGASGVAGGYIVGSVVFDVDTPADIGIAAICGLIVGLLLVRLLAWLYFLARARSPQLEAARVHIEAADKRLADLTASVPNLSFGQAILPRASQLIELPTGGDRMMSLIGRVIRVPVTNALGAGDAEKLHARIKFMTGSRNDGQFVPPPCQAEWFNERGEIEVEVDLPGNGRPRLIDAVLILDRPYPHAHEWTVHSRAALLRGYAIESDRFQVEITVEAKGAGELAPSLTQTLEVECGQGMLKANWSERHPDEATHLVGWNGQNM
jgi:hypothetical protein